MQIDMGSPNVKQKLFLTDKHKYVAFGGARGGGKSWAIRAKAILLCSKHAGIVVMIIRKTYPELIANHVKPLKKMLKIGMPGSTIKYNESRKELTFPNGSTIIFGYCNHESDTDRYQGTECDVLFLDEATQLSESQIKDLIVCVRSTNSYPHRVYFTCNPGGKGHGYIKRLFIDKEYLDGEYPEEYSFIQSLVYDNKVLMENMPDYVRQLEALPEAKRKAWLEGDWNSFIGQVFVEWRNVPSHYADHKWSHVIDEFDIPETWRIYRGFDHGYAKPFSVCWFALDHDGCLYLIDEWYGCTKQPNTGIQLSVQEIARGIKERENANPMLKGKVIHGIADPAIWGSTTGESIEDMLERCGVYNDKGDHTRLAGLMQYHYRLAFDENGHAMFYCFKSCKQFIRTLPLLIYDEKHVEDIDTELEDHIYDAARYVFMAHPLNPRKNIRRFTATDPLPPEDPLEIIKPIRRN